MSDDWQDLKNWVDDQFDSLRRSIGQQLRFMREAREKRYLKDAGLIVFRRPVRFHADRPRQP